jgi:hypothetical protein
LATPASAVLDADPEELAEGELAAGELLVAGALPVELVLELQAASSAAAVIAAPGATQRFHLCVIAFGSSIPPITSGA